MCEGGLGKGLETHASLKSKIKTQHAQCALCILLVHAVMLKTFLLNRGQAKGWTPHGRGEQTCSSGAVGFGVAGRDRVSQCSCGSSGCRGAAEEEAESLARLWEKSRLLGLLDELWIQYLAELRQLKASVSIRRAPHPGLCRTRRQAPLRTCWPTARPVMPERTPSPAIFPPSGAY